MTTPTRPPTVAEAQAALETADARGAEGYAIVDSYPPGAPGWQMRSACLVRLLDAAEQAADTLRAAQGREAREKANTIL